MEVKVRDHTLYALIDTSALNMFLSNEAAKTLRLHMEPPSHQYKVVNFQDVLAIGVARDVELQVGRWKGKLSFKIISLDDYDLILGLEFFNSARAMIDLRTKSNIITDLQCPSMVPMIHGLMETNNISIIQLMDDGPGLEESMT